jgi:putative nucleotidyltransferase with HDIG domain
VDLFRLAILVVVGVANIALAFVVYARNRKNAANRSFAGAVLVIVFWLALDYLGAQPALAEYSLEVNRATPVAGMLMGALLLYFALVFPQQETPLRPAWRLFFISGAVIMSTTLLTKAVVAAAPVTGSGARVVPGPLFPLFVSWVLVGIASTLYVFGSRYRRVQQRQKAQLKFVIMGVVMFAVSSLVLGLLLPVMTGAYEIARLNVLSTLLLTGFTAYAIVKHRLMDIRLVVLRSVAYATLLALAGAAFVVPVVLARSGLGRQFGIDPDPLIIIVGLVAVLGFQPMRHLLEGVTDRFFYRRTYDPTQLLSRLGLAMTSTLDLRGLAGMIAQELATQMRLDFAAVIFQHQEAAEVAAVGREFAHEDLHALLLACKRETLIVADDYDPGSDENEELASRGVRILAPLSASVGVVGAIVLGGKRSGEAFTSRDTDFLEILVSEASISIKNALLFDEKTQRVRELTALNELAFALGSSRELDALLDSALQQVAAVTGADTGSILLLEDGDETLTIAAAVGIPDDIVASTRIPVGEGIAGWVAECKEALVLVDDRDPRFAGELLREDIGSAICAPVLSKDEVIGVLNVNRKGGSELFTTENMHVVTSFAGQLGIAIENARLYTNLEGTFLGTISALAAAVDAKDPYTFGHSNEVTIHAVKIAEELGLEADDVQMIRIAATLHDIGKIGIDGAILLKPGKLTAEEREIINRHPAIGADILAPLDFLREAVPLVLFHHERFGGGGYPSGISGEAIPFGARIIAVADSFNAMVSDRPYREGLSLEAAMRELRENSGSQFDPTVVDAFLKLLNEGAIARRPELPVAPSPGWQFDRPSLPS